MFGVLRRRVAHLSKGPVMIRLSAITPSGHVQLGKSERFAVMLSECLHRERSSFIKAVRLNFHAMPDPGQIEVRNDA